jgi:hypothetical protein
MSIIGAAIGIGSSLLGGGSGPPYAKSLRETNNAGKRALEGDLAAVDTVGFKLQATKYEEVRAAARAWLTRVSLQGATPEVKARALGYLGTNGASATLPPTSTSTTPGSVATAPVPPVPAWLLVVLAAVVLWLIVRKG